VHRSPARPTVPRYAHQALPDGAMRVWQSGLLAECCSPGWADRILLWSISLVGVDKCVVAAASRTLADHHALIEEASQRCISLDPLALCDKECPIAA
jgi:hypothetical protein